MGQKENPILFRMPIRRDWSSRWFAKKVKYSKLLIEDEVIRRFLKKKLRYNSVSKVMIERAGNRVRVTIFTAKPGPIIGRKGQELEKLKEDIQKLTSNELLLDIQEVKKGDIDPQVVAESIALQLERRVPFRRAMKKAVETAIALGVKGIKIEVSGRLGGADIARKEGIKRGSVPLQTLRADIRYGFEEAHTVYGIIGVKVWICL